MRVLFVANYYPIPATPARGVFIRRQAQALARAGIDVTVVHPLPHVLPGAAWLTSRASHFRDLPLRCDDGPVHVLQPRYFTYPGHLRLGVPEIFQARAIERLRLEAPDVVHGQFAAPAGLAAMRIAGKWGVPFVLSLRGYDTNFWPHLNRFNRSRFQRVCRAADRLLANSADLAAKARTLTDVDAEVLSSGIDTAAFDNLPQRAQARRELDLPAQAFIALYVGNHIRAKGMEELMSTAQAQPDVRFVTIGAGPYRGRLAALSNVTGLAQQPFHRVVQFMRAADVLVLPSHSEGMPNVVLEAGAAGLPVVATDVGGIPELIGEDARGWLVPARNAPALSGAIRAVRKSPQDAHERAAALREHVRTHFNADAMASRLIEIYQELAAGGPASKPLS